MTIQNILKSVQSNNLEYSNYLLFGEEDFFIDEIEKTFLKYIIPEEEKTFNQKVFYGKETNVFDLIGVLKSFPMLGSKQLIVLKEANKLDKISELENYFQHPIPTSIFLICYKNKTVDKRKKWVKLFQHCGLIFESKKLYAQNISQWISGNLMQRGMAIKREAEALLIDSLGVDLPKINNAFNKLETLVSNQTITFSDVQEHIGLHREYNTFELQNALAERNNYKIIAISDYFTLNSNKFPLPPIIGLLLSFFSKLLIIHSLDNHNDKYIATKIKVHPFFVRTYTIGYKNYTFDDCVQIVSFLKDTDLKFKGIINSSAYPLQELMLKIISK